MRLDSLIGEEAGVSGGERVPVLQSTIEKSRLEPYLAHFRALLSMARTSFRRQLRLALLRL